jgi:adhesin transport system membrane fusion protein
MSNPSVTPRLSAFNATKTPRLVSILTRCCVFLFVLIPVLLLISPWQQNIRASGKVTAFAPIERQQKVESPVSGRITQWFVREGAKVKAGDTLVEIVDVDPDLLPRLTQQRDAAKIKFEAKQDELRAYKLQIDNLVSTRDLQISTAQYRLDVAAQRAKSAQETILSTQATLDTANLQLERLNRLLVDGLVSKRDAEVAERDKIIALRNLNSQQAALNGAIAEQRAAETEIGRIRSDAQARVNSATASMNKTQSEVEDARSSLLKNDIDVSRQTAQIIKAPRDGSVLRLLANPQGDLVRQGDALLILVPDTNVKAVELWVNGNDVTLITKGRHARLQFEGWPALQFAGWPEVAVGTFGGNVAFVDATDDGKGKFRVVITPDEGGQEWPSERFLRQGVRVEGWILLNRVTMIYELWRQLNAFPPIYEPEKNEK